MRIVVNHLTRMQPGFICVAGLDWESGAHVRPLPPEGRLRQTLLAVHGGPLAIGAIVELGVVQPCGRPPEVEDCRFSPRAAVRVGSLEAGEFWETLQSVSADRLRALFGPALRPLGRQGCGVGYAEGRASLGCLTPSGPQHLYRQPREYRADQIRLRTGDGEFELDLAVTDISLYGVDHQTPDWARVEATARELEAGRATILSVGLTRAMTRGDDRPPMHWLQVNNVHLQPAEDVSAERGP